MNSSETSDPPVSPLRQRWRNLPVKRKLTAVTFTIAAVMIGATSLGCIVFSQHALRHAMRERAMTAARVTASGLGYELERGSKAAADQTLRWLIDDPDVVAACVYDANGAVLAELRRPEGSSASRPRTPRIGLVTDGGYLEATTEISVNGGRLGLLWTRWTQRDVSRLEWVNIGVMGAILAIGTVLAFLSAARMHRGITEPLADLLDVATKASRDRDYSVRARRNAADEIGQFVAAFNELLARVESRDADLESRVQERTQRLMQEIAERTHAQEELRRSEFFLRKTQEIARLGSYVLEVATGRWTSSPVLREIFGIDETYATDIAGWVGLIAPDQRDEMRAYFEQHVIGRRQRFAKEYRIVRKSDGQERWVSGMGELELDEQGTPVRMIGTIRDITERKRAESAWQASEEKYRHLTEDITDVVWEVDANERFTYISPADEILRGFKSEEVIGHRSSEWMDEPSKARVRTIVENQDGNREGGIPTGVIFEARQRRTDGSYVWTEICARPFRDAEGRIIGYRGTTRDISARKQIEEELRESQARITYERDQLQALLEASPDAIYFKDLDSKLVRTSTSKALKMIRGVAALRDRQAAHPELSPVEIVAGLTDFDTYTPADAKRAFEDEQEVIRTGQPLLNQLEKQVFMDGTVVWHLTHKVPWRDRTGRIVGTFGVSKDITDLKRAEENLEKAHRQLVVASREAGMAEVATGVLHNVGNALNSVNVSASVALDQVRASRAGFVTKVAEMLHEHSAELATFLADDPKGRRLPEYLLALGQALAEERTRVVRELEDLRKNIEHIKEIVAMQQSYASLAGVLEPVSVTEIVEDAIRLNSGALNRHHVKLVRAFNAEPVITTDRHKVLQILVNLLRNAKYACDDSERMDKQVTVEIDADAHHVRIAISDNGVGIPEENLVRIFAHGFTTRKGGHGFGLHSGAVAAKELGGALAVVSKGHGHGAVFTLELPLAAPGEHGREGAKRKAARATSNSGATV